MDQDDPTPDDFDTPWKTALTRYLPEFMAFYFPEAHAAIDWQQPHRFLDQELAQVVRDAQLGKRLVDRLVEVSTLAHGRQWVYIHLEVQGQRDKEFAERLFTSTTTGCTIGIIARWQPWRCSRTSRRGMRPSGAWPGCCTSGTENRGQIYLFTVPLRTRTVGQSRSGKN
jgi:hypothetical protein